MDEGGVGLVDELVEGGFTVLEGWGAEGDLAEVGFDGIDFALGCVLRHDDVGGGVVDVCGAGECGGVVAGGVGGDAALKLFGGELEDGVGGASVFESADGLEMFGFEGEVGVGEFVEEAGGEDGGLVDVRFDACVGGLDVIEVGEGEVGRCVGGGGCHACCWWMAISTSLVQSSGISRPTLRAAMGTSE